MKPEVSADVRHIVEMAIGVGANVDVAFEEGGEVRVSIYPSQAPADERVSKLGQMIDQAADRIRASSSRNNIA
ncbi:hypothetical protein [Shinella sp.]|uniref:hypothetical protein n=1 Tax=Shinella sp. TaxID=1870904 RepID=UPI00301B85D2